MNFSASPGTSAARSSLGKPKPIRSSSAETEAYTSLPTRNLVWPPTRYSVVRGSDIAIRRTPSTVAMAYPCPSAFRIGVLPGRLGRTAGGSGAFLAVEVVEVVALVDARDQVRLLGPPSQPLPGQRARRRVVERHEGGQEAEVIGRVRRGHADHRELQLAADGLSDVPERHALLARSVQPRTGRGGLGGQ